MQRRATFAAGTAAAALLLGLGLTACSPGFSGDDGVNGGSTPATDPVSEPGRHSSLPVPCKAPEQDRLAELLPDADDEALEGRPRVTYDTGRRAACDWEAQDGDASYRLSVDYLRMISYDPEISDNDRAALDFAERAAEAGISLDTETETGSSATEGTSDDGTDSDSDTGSDTDTDTESGTDDGTDDSEADGAGTAGVGADLADGSTRPVGELAPRALDDIGQAAYIDDRLSAEGSRRDITLVFHSSNVIVVIDYSQSLDATGEEPDSAVLQELVQHLAEQLADRLED